MLLSQPLRIISIAVLLTAGVALANDSAKQLPLEIPPSLLDTDAAKPAEKAKPEAAKKSAPKTDKVAAREVTAVNLPAAANPAAKPAVQPAKDLSGLPEMASYKTKAADTLDKIVQKFYPASPLRTEVLRDALIQNNPMSFPKGNAKSLVIGSTLSIPDQVQLAQKLLQLSTDTETPAVAVVKTGSPAPAVATPAVPAGGGGAAAHSAGHNMALQDPKRQWVRYP